MRARENHFGFVGLQNDNNPKFQGWHIYSKKILIMEVTYESDDIFLFCNSTM